MTASVLYLVPDLIGPPGGIARYCRLVSQALLETGTDLHVVALSDLQTETEQVAERFPAMKYVPCSGSHPTFLRQSFGNDLRLQPGLIMVGHVNFAPLGWALARLTGAKMVTFVYGIDAWSRLPRVRRFSLQQSSRIVAISRYTAKRAASANAMDATKLRVLHNCLDPKFEEPLPHPIARGAPSLLTVARMNLAEQYKGHDVVIRALPELIRRFPGLVYHVVGDGDARPGLESLAQQIGVVEAVRFHGIVSETALREHYAQSTLFIMPSRAEGFGFVFLEAMAQGLPVVAGNLDATPEVVVDGETGLLVDPSSPAAIAEAVASLLANPERRARMSAAAQRRVQEHFSFAGFQRQLTHILAEMDSGWDFQA